MLFENQSEFFVEKYIFSLPYRAEVFDKFLKGGYDNIHKFHRNRTMSIF